MSDNLTDKFTEMLDLWKRRAIAVFALLSLLVAMLVALVVEVGGGIEVTKLKFGVDKVHANADRPSKGIRHCKCRCVTHRSLSK